ncbi:Ribosomal large subunit pseudouridine synthase A, partial [Haemophilus influenzae]
LCIIKPISLFNRNKNEIYFFQYKWFTCSPTST